MPQLNHSPIAMCEGGVQQVQSTATVYTIIKLPTFPERMLCESPTLTRRTCRTGACTTSTIFADRFHSTSLLRKCPNLQSSHLHTHVRACMYGLVALSLVKLVMAVLIMSVSHACSAHTSAYGQCLLPQHIPASISAASRCSLSFVERTRRSHSCCQGNTHAVFMFNIRFCTRKNCVHMKSTG